MTLVIRPVHASLLGSIRRAPSSPRVVVIGAAAVLHHIALPRDTGDVDLAIVADEKAIRSIFESAGWDPDRHAKQRWRHDASQCIVDVLPATPRIIEDGYVRLEGDDKEMSMVGFDLALTHTVKVQLPDGRHEVDVATLPVLAMLKMVAWLDRPHDRTKDLGDIAHILDGSLDDDDPRRWEPPLDTIEHEDQSAFFAGRELGSMVKGHHRTKIDDFFGAMAKEPWYAVMARERKWLGVDPEAIAGRRLDAFRRGLA